MVCRKCKSDDVLIQVITKTKTKYRGCLGWALWILLAVCTCGLILIVPAITNERHKSKNYTVAVCQCCGHRWKV